MIGCYPRGTYIDMVITKKGVTCPYVQKQVSCHMDRHFSNWIDDRNLYLFTNYCLWKTIYNLIKSPYIRCKSTHELFVDKWYWYCVLIAFKSVFMFSDLLKLLKKFRLYMVNTLKVLTQMIDTCMLLFVLFNAGNKHWITLVYQLSYSGVVIDEKKKYLVIAHEYGTNNIWAL